MILDLRDLEDFPARLVLEAQPGEIEPDHSDLTAIEKVRLNLQVQKSGEEYFCQGKISARVNLECARCLKDYDQDVTAETDFIIRGDEPPTDSRGARDDEDYVLLQRDDLQADVSPMVRQAIILVLPMKPLCSEQCRGLCPECGANLNDGECGCKRERIDPRWEGLKDLAGRDRP
jgi:uncharacterized protein